jgi:hypothetical protein
LFSIWLVINVAFARITKQFANLEGQEALAQNLETEQG